jgi:RNA polymerase sigma factor (TIGR02999 family)
MDLADTNNPPTKPTTPTASPALTALLVSWRSGDGAAFDRVIESAYQRLKEMAAGRLRGDNVLVTLSPAELLNEAIVRVMESPPDFKSRSHFFATMSLLMRSILVDAARARLTSKRGGGALNVTLNETQMGEDSVICDLLALDQALQQLAALDPRGSEILHLTYFGGMKCEEIATVLDTSQRTVERELRFARAWVSRAMGGAAGSTI